MIHEAIVGKRGGIFIRYPGRKFSLDIRGERQHCASQCQGDVINYRGAQIIKYRGGVQERRQDAMNISISAKVQQKKKKKK